jgi:hypothetical protein
MSENELITLENMVKKELEHSAEIPINEILKANKGKVTFGDEFVITCHELEVGKRYILSSFFTNAYITMDLNGRFITDQVLGDPLKFGIEYLIIEPAY